MPGDSDLHMSSGSSGTIRLQKNCASAHHGHHVGIEPVSVNLHAGWPRSHLTLRCLHVSQLTLSFSRLRFEPL